MATRKQPPVLQVVPSKLEQILEVRGTRYGKFVDHADVTQQLKTVLKNHCEQQGTEVTASQAEALDMICHKLGRIVNGDPNYEDSWRDIAGYAQLVADELIGIEQ